MSDFASAARDAAWGRFLCSEVDAGRDVPPIAKRAFDSGYAAALAHKNENEDEQMAAYFTGSREAIAALSVPAPLPESAQAAALREARSRYLNLLTSLRESGKAVPNEQSLIEAYDFAVTYYLSPKPESAQAAAQPADDEAAWREFSRRTGHNSPKSRGIFLQARREQRDAKSSP